MYKQIDLRFLYLMLNIQSVPKIQKNRQYVIYYHELR